MADAAWQRRRDVPLTGADGFLRAFDHDTRRRNGASHLSQLVLRLGPGFDLAGFQALFWAMARANPIVRAPIVRPYGLLPPVYRTTRPSEALPRVVVHPEPAEGAAGGERRVDERPLPAVFLERLNDRFDLRRGELLCCDVVPYDGGRAGTDLALTWAHLLLDGHGSERLVSWLERCHRGERRVDDLGPEEGAGLREGSAQPGAPPRERGRMARAWQARMAELARTPPRSPADGPTRARQALRVALTTLSPEDTRRVVARAQEKAGFLTPVLFHLAAAIRAHAALHRVRGSDPRSFALPVVANLRPRGPGASAIFRTHVSMLWFQAMPEETRDLDGLIERLKAQRLARIQQGFLEEGAAAMDFARWAPAPLYAAMARRTLRGELASFFFAYTGEFLADTKTFCGAEIVNGFHAPGVPASPGSGTILSLRQGRLNAAHVHQDGLLREAEREAYEARLVADLTGREP